MKTADILPLVPRYMAADGLPEGFNLPSGLLVSVALKYDADHGAPWDECDGHGPVSEWRDKDSKRPGERILCADRHRARFYDFAEAVKIARRDGWGAKGDKGMKPGAKAAHAAEADFEYLRAWCADEWRYVGVTVKVRTSDGAHEAEASLWGVESLGDYWREVVADLVIEACIELASAQRTVMLRKAFL